MQTYLKVPIEIKFKTLCTKICPKEVIIIKKSIRKMKITKQIFILIVLQRLVLQAIQRNLEVNLKVIKYYIKNSRRQRTLLFIKILIKLLRDKGIHRLVCIKRKKIIKFKK